MANPIMRWLRGDDVKTVAPAPPEQKIIETKLHYYPDQLNPGIATDIGGAIRMGTLVHGPGASEMIYRAWHHEDSNSAVYACLTAICTAYPEAPLKVFRDDSEGERDHLDDHPLQQLLDNPNPYLTREHLWHYVQWCKHVNGNGYLRKDRSGSGLPAYLWPISPMRLVPVTTKEDAARGVFISWYAYKYDPAKDPELIPPEDIIHFRMGIDDRDHRLGSSPLAKLVREVAGDDAATEWQTSLLANGAVPGLVVQGPVGASFSEEQAEAIVEGISERFGGSKRGRVGMLTGGATIQQVGFDPEQMDMKALHRIPEERIAAVMRVPAIIAGLGAGLDRSTYANFREAREMFAEMTILPLYVFDAAVINMQLTPEFTRDKQVRVAFDTTDLRALQEDEDAKWKRLNEAVKTGWVRPNEARTDVGLPPDMDDELVSPPGQGRFAVEEEPSALPAGEEEEPEKRRRRVGEVKAGRKLENLPEWLQAIVDVSEPGFERDLQRYANQQKNRIKRRLVG